MANVINIPQSPIVNLKTGYVTQVWQYWFQNPQIQTIIISSPVPVDQGGTGLTAGTSGGVLAFVGSTTMASSATLGANQIVLGGGVGVVPYTLGSTGTTTQLLHGNASGAPTWSSLANADIPSTTITAGKLSATAASILFGRGSAGGAGAGQEITVGTGLSISGTVLNSTGGDVTGPGSSTNNAVAKFNGTTGKIIQNSGVIIDSSNNLSAASLISTGGSTPGVGTTEAILWTAGGTQPRIDLIDSTRSSGGRIAGIGWTGGTLSFQFANDTFAASTSFMAVVGTSASITSVTCSGAWTIPAGNFTATNGAAPSAATSAVKIWQTSNVPIVNWIDSSRAAGARLVTGYYQSGTFSFGYTNDAFSVTLNFMDVVGTSAAITSITFPNGNVVITNNLTVNGNTTIGNASGDTLTVAPNAVTWSNNPTHSGNHVFSGNVSINGNPTLGDAAGDTVTVTGTPAGQVIGSTYTPTATAATNLDATPTVQQAQYMRVGATVTVSGTFSANPTAPGAASFELSLPVASNIGATEDCAGVAFSGAIAGQGAAVTGSIANNTAVVSWIAVDVTNQSWSFTFTYQII